MMNQLAESSNSNTTLMVSMNELIPLPFFEVLDHKDQIITLYPLLSIKIPSNTTSELFISM
jgi:hypothetical protein